MNRKISWSYANDHLAPYSEHTEPTERNAQHNELASWPPSVSDNSPSSHFIKYNQHIVCSHGGETYLRFLNESCVYAISSFVGSQHEVSKQEREKIRSHEASFRFRRNTKTKMNTCNNNNDGKKHQTIIKRDTANDQPNLFEDAFKPKTEVAFLARGINKRTHTRSIRKKKLKLIFVYREKKNSNSRKGRKHNQKHQLYLSLMRKCLLPYGTHIFCSIECWVKHFFSVRIRILSLHIHVHTQRTVE